MLSRRLALWMKDEGRLGAVGDCRARADAEDARGQGHFAQERGEERAFARRDGAEDVGEAAGGEVEVCVAQGRVEGVLGC